MSEMIKNSDVEDVLFSIRRLVSDTSEAKPTPSAKVEKQNTEALFLTSSLRVNDPATEPEQVDLEDMTTGLSHFRDAIGRKGTDTADLPPLDDAFKEASLDETPRRLHLTDVVRDDLETESFLDGDAGFVEEALDDLDTGSFGARKWAEDLDVDKLSDFATPDDTFGAMEAETARKTANEPPKDDTPETAKAVEESPKASAKDLKTLGEDDDTLGVADGLADFDENILDEDALRDMVTEIVREELSGQLGERITRNVRKLVRREIHRALLTREFD